MADYLTGGDQTTINSTITELFPALWFNTKRNPPKSVEELSEYIKTLDFSSLNSSDTFVDVADLKSGEAFRYDAYSKIEPKMLRTKLENAFGITNYLYDVDASKPIKNVYWGYRRKPTGVPSNHAGDLFLMFKDGSITGISLKAGTDKSAEPKLNSYVKSTITKPCWKKIRPTVESDFKTILWKEVYSKVPMLPKTVNATNFYTTSGKSSKINPELDKAIYNMFEHDKDKFEELYQKQNDASKEILCDLINSSVEATLEWINEEFRLEKPQEVPLVLVKAVKTKATEQGDDLANFLHKVTKVKAYTNKKSVQEWFIDVSDDNGKTLTLLMTIRSDSEYRKEKRKGKLGALAMLKLLYRGVKK